MICGVRKMGLHVDAVVYLLYEWSSDGFVVVVRDHVTRDGRWTGVMPKAFARSCYRPPFCFFT